MSKRSWPGFEDQVKWRLCGPAESRKATARDDFLQALLPRLRSKRKPYFLRQGCRRTQQCGRSIKRAPNRVEIVLQLIAGKRFDDHPRTVLLKPAVHVSGRTRRIAHVMQAIEKCDEIIVFARKRFRAGHLKLDPVAYARSARALLCRFYRLVMVVESGKLGFRVGFRHQDRRGAQPAADVGDTGTAFQLFLYSV